MNLQGIYHKSKSNYSYAYNEKEVHIRLRTSKEDCIKVLVYYGDKYDWKNSQVEEMKIICNDGLYNYYGIEVIPQNNRLAYYFKLQDEKETYYYTEGGYYKEEIPVNQLHYHYFQIPFINKTDVHFLPEWVKDTVFYSIFPERFFDGNKLRDKKITAQWGEKPTYKDFYGGDLEGIISKLDYLEDLGINGIYLTPIFQSPTNHKYDTTDYFKVDNALGDLEVLKVLVKECHKRDIKIILDAVFNHSGYFFEPFQDVIKNGPKSKYYNWFHIKEWPLSFQPPSYHTFAFVAEMPKLNTENPEVRKYLFEVATYWIKETNIDGWRLDVSDEIDHGFWREFRKTVKDIKNDAYIIGEVWHNPEPWLRGDQFDTVMNYSFMKNCINYFVAEKFTTEEFKAAINKMLMRNTQQVNQVMYNLLDSHDTPRLISQPKGSIEKLMMAAVFQMTFIGSPSIYYGTEIGMEGEEDPDCRRTMEWDTEKWNMEVYELYKKLIYLRKKSMPLKRGTFRWLNDVDHILAYIRELEAEKVVILINNTPMEKEITLTCIHATSYIDYLTGEELSSKNINIGGYNSKILLITR